MVAPESIEQRQREQYLAFAQLLLHKMPECFGHPVTSGQPIIVRFCPSLQKRRAHEIAKKQRSAEVRTQQRSRAIMGPPKPRVIKGGRLVRQLSITGAEALLELNPNIAPDESCLPVEESERELPEAGKFSPAEIE